MLWGDTNESAGFSGVLKYIDPVDSYRASVGAGQSGNDRQQRALPGTIATEERNDCPRLYL